jgi:hypothetical protein
MRKALYSGRSTGRACLVSVASTEDGAISAALDTVPKPAKVGDAGPISIHEVRREGNVVQVEIAVQDDKPPAGKERTSSFLSKVQRRTGRYPYRS